jgi:hypothetical protein
MKKLHFSIEIDASPEHVWEAIVNDVPYREWTEAFCAGSRFKGGWNKGDAIRFFAGDENGELEGMISEIAESRKPEYISIHHLGQIREGKEDFTSDAVKAWAPSYENYTIIPVANGTTRFEVAMDADDSFVEMFSEMWPRALLKLKAVAERLEYAAMEISMSLS